MGFARHVSEPAKQGCFTETHSHWISQLTCQLRIVMTTLPERLPQRNAWQDLPRNRASAERFRYSNDGPGLLLYLIGKKAMEHGTEPVEIDWLCHVLVTAGGQRFVARLGPVMG